MRETKGNAMKRATLDRRQLGLGLMAATALPLAAGLRGSPARAQSYGGPWSQLGDLSQEAQKLGLSVPRMGLAPAEATEDFTELQPAIVDFMDSVAASAPDAPGATSADVDSLVDRASELLRGIRNAERAPRDIPEGPSAAAVTPPKFEDIADEYRKLFETCEIRTANRSDVQWYVTKITDPARRKSYEQCFEETCVPWYVVAIIHGMECSFDFNSHLHNGDSLKAKTKQVPAGRPNPWLPPSDWVSSAVDAIRYDKLHEQADWSLPRILYRWEGYNGWRSRLLYKINTPYLWSFSNHYTKGKFVADNKWDPNAVSKQCGAAVMLKALVEGGHIAQPA
jgi:lysozyme family protein